MKQVGTFHGAQGEINPLYMYGVLMQSPEPDGIFLVPRGGNFLENTMVETDYSFLSEFLANPTANDGLEQPAVGSIPTPYNYTMKWVVDLTYKVIGYGFLKNGEQASFPTFDTKEEAQKYLDEHSGGVDPIPEPNHARIAIRLFQECENNDGVHFMVEPFYPDSDYEFSIEDTYQPNSARIDITSDRTCIIRNNDNKLNGYFRIYITDRKTGAKMIYDSWSSTCNHDGKPTDCPPNNNKLVITTPPQRYEVGDILDVLWLGQFSCTGGAINWYNQNAEVLSQAQVGAHIKVTGFPMVIHAQPNCAGCHGWTELIIG